MEETLFQVTLVVIVRHGCVTPRTSTKDLIVTSTPLYVFSAPLKFKVATVPKSGLPPEFKYHGLRNLPAIIHGEEVRVGPRLDIARFM